MRYLILITLFSIQASALTDVDKAEIYNQNLLLNNGFENGKSKWSATAGTFSYTTSSTYVLKGKASGTWDAAASGNILSSNAVTMQAGQIGRNGVATCMIAGAAVAGTMELQAYDATAAAVLAEVEVDGSNTEPVRMTINFIFPSTASSMQLRLYANADEGQAYIDDCYLGLAEGYNLGMAKPQDVFSAKVSSTGTVSGENADWINGNGSIASTSQYTLTFNSGFFTSSPNCEAITDNSTAFSPNIQATIHTAATSGAITVRTYNVNSSAASVSDFIIHCQKAGADALQPAYRPDQVAMSWSGYHDSTCSWSRTNAAYGDPTADASCALVERTNSNFGTVSTSGSVLPAITFTPKRAGRYYVCTFPSVSGATANANLGVKMWDGTTTIAETESLGQGSTGRNFSQPACGVYVASSTSAVTISLQTKASGGAIQISAAAGIGALEWSIFAIDNQLPAPLLINSVTNTASSVTGIEAANINCDAGSAITSQRGSWVSSVGNVSGGACAVTLSGTYSSTPYCWAEPNAAFASTGLILSTAASSSTAISVDCEDDASTACTSFDFNLFCLGQK